MNTPSVITRETHHHSDIRLPGSGFSDEQFLEFCLLNRELRIERNADGKIIVMSPTTSSTGFHNGNIFGELFIWNKQNQFGYLFDSSSGFTFPNGAVRSPDVSWIRKERWDALPQPEKERFAAICPDFVIELRSDSDNLNELQEKMAEYIASGCSLAWLIDPVKRQTTVYSAGNNVEVLPFDNALSGNKILPGFVLKMDEIIPSA